MYALCCVLCWWCLCLFSRQNRWCKKLRSSLSLSHTHTAHSIYLRLRGALPSFKFSHLFHNNNISFPFARAYLFHFAHSIYTNKYDGFDGYSFRICIQFAWHIFFFSLLLCLWLLMLSCMLISSVDISQIATRYSLTIHFNFSIDVCISMVAIDMTLYWCTQRCD